MFEINNIQMLDVGCQTQEGIGKIHCFITNTVQLLLLKLGWLACNCCNCLCILGYKAAQNSWDYIDFQYISQQTSVQNRLHVVYNM